MKYYKTATRTAKANHLIKLNNKMILNADTIPDEYRKIIIAEMLKKYSNGYNLPPIDFDFISYKEETAISYLNYIKTRSVYADFTIQVEIVEDYKGILYRIYTVKDYRIADYTAEDIYYNRKPSIYREHGNINNHYAATWIEYQEETAA